MPATGDKTQCYEQKQIEHEKFLYSY